MDEGVRKSRIYDNMSKHYLVQQKKYLMGLWGNSKHLMGLDRFHFTWWYPIHNLVVHRQWSSYTIWGYFGHIDEVLEEPHRDNFAFLDMATNYELMMPVAFELIDPSLGFHFLNYLDFIKKNAWLKSMTSCRPVLGDQISWIRMPT